MKLTDGYYWILLNGVWKVAEYFADSKSFYVCGDSEPIQNVDELGERLLPKETGWEKYEREDLKIIPKAISSGWKVGFNYKDENSERTTPERPPLFPVHFEKGKRSVWKGSVYWITGILGRDGFHDKKTLNSLNEIFSL